MPNGIKKPKLVKAEFYFVNGSTNLYKVAFFQQTDKTMQEVVISENQYCIYDEIIMAVANKTNALELLIKAIN